MNCTKCGVKANSELCFRCKPRKPLKRTRLKTKATKIPFRSKKRIIQEREYAKIRREFLTDNPNCEFNDCNKESTDCHHAKGRIGKLLTDRRYFIALCREHHQFIELNPQFAKDNGYSISRLAKE